tara:strand:- start:7040 stop:7747 length:708 start_codon:yes stop_codon:yes gene_type:complete
MKLYKNAKGDDLCVSEEFVKEFESKAKVSFELVAEMLHGTSLNWKNGITDDGTLFWNLTSDCHLDNLIYPVNEHRNPNGQPLQLTTFPNSYYKEEHWNMIGKAFTESDIVENREFYGKVKNKEEIAFNPDSSYLNNLPTTQLDVEKVYVYSEGKFLDELRTHIDKTNQTHYAGPVQPTEFIMSHASSLDFLVGNVIKYTFRFGKKNGYNKEDLFKAAHYLSMMAHFADEKFEKKE